MRNTMISKPFFHYTKINSAIKILESSLLKLSFAPKVNDPFDLNKDIIYNPNDTNGEELFREIYKDKTILSAYPCFSNNNKIKPKNLLFIINAQLNNWGFKNDILNTPFICFSAKNDIQLMWSHYGDQHKGVVLEFCGSTFDRSEIVKYKSFQKLPTVLSTKRFIKLIFKKDKNELHKFGIELLITKHSDWSYEEEMRVILNPNGYYQMIDDDKFYSFHIKKLTCIYFGLECNEKNIDSIKNKILSLGLNHIQLFNMIRKPGYLTMRPEKMI